MTVAPKNLGDKGAPPLDVSGGRINPMPGEGQGSADGFGNIVAATIPFASVGGGASSFIPLLGNRSMANLIVPPGGFAGFAQQSPATQLLFQKAGRLGGKRSAAKRRRKRKTAKATTTRRRRRTGTRRRAKLVKGSAAAKRYMASIRKRRKRK